MSRKSRHGGHEFQRHKGVWSARNAGGGAYDLPEEHTTMTSDTSAGITVAGVDFGTLSVRVSLFNSKRGRLGSGTAEYPLERTKDDPDQATQGHEDHMNGLEAATRAALAAAGISGEQVASIALDTTGSSVIPVGAGMVP